MYLKLANVVENYAGKLISKTFNFSHKIISSSK